MFALLQNAITPSALARTHVLLLAGGIIVLFVSPLVTGDPWSPKKGLSAGHGGLRRKRGRKICKLICIWGKFCVVVLATQPGACSFLNLRPMSVSRSQVPLLCPATDQMGAEVIRQQLSCNYRWRQAARVSITAQQRIKNKSRPQKKKMLSCYSPPQTESVSAPLASFVPTPRQLNEDAANPVLCY